jgi:hypothetical protein
MKIIAMLIIAAIFIYNLQKDNISWICCKCDTQNAGSFTYHSYELETSNQFSALGSVSSAASMSTILSIGSSFRSSVFSRI